MKKLLILLFFFNNTIITFSQFPVSGLTPKLWYKADALNFSDNTPISVWYDSSGNAQNLSQASNVQKPVLKTNVLNGKPVLRFDGLDDFLSGNISINFQTLQQPLTFCIVYQYTGSNDGAWHTIFSGISSGELFMGLNGSDDLRVSAGGGYASMGIKTVPYTQFVVTTIIFATTYLEYYENGLLVANPPPVGSGGLSQLNIGSYLSSSLYSAMDVAEIVVVGKALTTTERQSVETYLGNKWNVFPLPVQLNSFTGEVRDNKVTLNWQTQSEINNAGFAIQKLENNIWKTIGFVKGNGTITTINNYSFVDANVKSGKYNYRLQQKDNDGTVDYSDEIKVTIVPTQAKLYQNFPNPYNPTTTITYEIPKTDVVNLKVYDILGKEITTLVNQEMQAGIHTVNFDANQLSGGIYFYKITAGSFSEVKRMMLVK